MKWSGRPGGVLGTVIIVVVAIFVVLAIIATRTQPHPTSIKSIYSAGRGTAMAAGGRLQSGADLMSAAGLPAPTTTKADQCMVHPAEGVGGEDYVYCTFSLALVFGPVQVTTSDSESDSGFLQAEHQALQAMLAAITSPQALARVGRDCSSLQTEQLKGAVDNPRYNPYPADAVFCPTSHISGLIDLADQRIHTRQYVVGLDRDPANLQALLVGANSFMLAIVLSDTYIVHAPCAGCYSEPTRTWPPPSP